MTSHNHSSHHSNSSQIRTIRPVKILDPILANQIAAGEVVERPASAIKELLENALDAGSTELTIEIREGGRTLMRVTDNGHGMSKDDALLALERHATSKISAVDDLNEINTLGFRGEALPSIASVSRFQILTRVEEAQSATLIQIEGGKNPQVCEGAGRVGTEVRVEDLFFNIPARRKFLKSAQTESGIIHEGVQRLALAYPQVAFKFIKDDHISLELPSHRSPLERIRALFGARVADHICPVAWSGPIRLTGFVSHPSFHFSAHRHAYTFINGRFVKDRLFLGAIQRAFGQRLPRGRYPFYLLNLDIHPSLVDVNVHPAKTQVRFVNEEALLDVLTKAFKAAMNEMAFEEHTPSWRERVVDQAVLPKLHDQSDSKPAGSQTQTQEQSEINASLEAHRARIQARLRQHLHGEDAEFISEQVDETSKVSPQASNQTSIDRTTESPIVDATQKVNHHKKRTTAEGLSLESSGRHDVQRVTQADLATWKEVENNGSNSLTPSHTEVLSKPTNITPTLSSNDDEYQKLSTSTSSSPPSPLPSPPPLLSSVEFPSSGHDAKEYRPLLPNLDTLHSAQARQQLRAVGRADEWWIQEASDGVLMIHLPTARVHALTDNPSPHQLNTAIQLSLNALEEKELVESQEELNKLGVTLDPFGGQIYRLVTLPIGLENDEPQRLIAMLHDLLSSRNDPITVAWSKELLNLPLSFEGRAFTLKWLDAGGAPDPSLPPFTLSMSYQEMVRKCEHIHPF
jgi:DNA mismatch repair protein MutL